MNNSNNNSEIKKFLLKHKQEFKNNRNGNRSISCFICPLRKAKEELHYGELTCLEIYKDIIASFGKKPIDPDPSTCAQAFSEIVRIGFKNYIIKNE